MVGSHIIERYNSDLMYSFWLMDTSRQRDKQRYQKLVVNSVIIILITYF